MAIFNMNIEFISSQPSKRNSQMCSCLYWICSYSRCEANVHFSFLAISINNSHT